MQNAASASERPLFSVQGLLKSTWELLQPSLGVWDDDVWNWQLLLENPKPYISHVWSEKQGVEVDVTKIRNAVHECPGPRDVDALDC
jgi:hypothetical protein